MDKYVQFKKQAKKRRVFSAFNAFPTPSGDKHVGHVRGDVLTDIIARWEQLNGAEIFYPTGIHATGRDVPTILEKILSPRTAEYYSLSLDVSYDILALGDYQKQFDILKETFSDISDLERKTTALTNNPTLQQLYNQSPILRENYLTIFRCIDTLLNDKDKKIKDVWEKEKRKILASLYKTVEETTQREFLLNDFRKYYNISGQEANNIAITADSSERSFRLLDLFKERYFATLHSLNIAITEDAFFTTADPAFHRYTQWAMRKLKEQKLIYMGKRPVPWCDVCQESKEIESSEASVKIDSGSAEDFRIEEYTLIKFRDQQQRIVLIATKKPETVYEATNLWAAPKGKYVIAKYHRNKHPEQIDTVIVSEESLANLVNYYHLNVLEQQSISMEELQQLNLENPVTEQKDLRIIPAAFVDPEQGTGLVMSVPILDPHDYRYHHDNQIGISLEGKVLIKTKADKSLSVDEHQGYKIDRLPGTLKEQILAATPQQLEVLKKKMYDEQDAGVMTQGDYKSVNVKHARQRLNEDLFQGEIGNKISYLEDIVAYCRSHPETRIRLAREKEPSVRLGDKKWQDATIERIKKYLRTTPAILKEKLIDDEDDKGIIRTRREKSCRRNAKGNIGTPIPADIIATKHPSVFEALADSNVYLEFYKIAQFLHRGLLQERQLTDALFDYFFLDVGDKKELATSLDISINKIKQMKREIDMTYPVGLNTAGTEHESVHIPYSLSYHAAILPEKFFPREYLMHGLVTRRKTDENGKQIGRPQKMGKSKGNAIPLTDAIEHAQHFFYADVPIANLTDSVSTSLNLSWNWTDFSGTKRKADVKTIFENVHTGVDLLRYFTARSSKIGDDFEWDDNLRDGVYKRCRDVVRHLTLETLALTDSSANTLQISNDLTELDQWFLSKMHGYIALAASLFQERKLRKATIVASDLMTNTYNTYRSREGKNLALLRDYLESQLSLLYPIIPTVTTTLYETLTGKQVMHGVPLADKSKIDIELEFRLDYPTDQAKKDLLDGIKRTLLPYISYAAHVDNIGLLEKEQENVIKIYLPSAAEAHFLKQEASFLDQYKPKEPKLSLDKQFEYKPFDIPTCFEYIHKFLSKPLAGKSVRFELDVDPTVANPYIRVNDKYTVDFASNIKPKPGAILTTSGNLSPV